MPSRPEARRGAFVSMPERGGRTKRPRGPTRVRSRMPGSRAHAPRWLLPRIQSLVRAHVPSILLAETRLPMAATNLPMPRSSRPQARCLCFSRSNHQERHANQRRNPHSIRTESPGRRRLSSSRSGLPGSPGSDGRKPWRPDNRAMDQFRECLSNDPVVQRGFVPLGRVLTMSPDACKRIFPVAQRGRGQCVGAPSLSASPAPPRTPEAPR
jgi:hypothetical protein